MFYEFSSTYATLHMCKLGELWWIPHHIEASIWHLQVLEFKLEMWKYINHELMQKIGVGADDVGTIGVRTARIGMGTFCLATTKNY